MEKQVRKILVLVLSVLATFSSVVVHAKPVVVFQADARGGFQSIGYTGQTTENNINWGICYGQNSSLFLVGQGLGEGEIKIFKSAIFATWEYNGHLFELDVRLITDENTKLCAASISGSRIVEIGYQQTQEYSLRFDGSFKVDGTTFDLAEPEWVGFIRIYDIKSWDIGESVELRLRLNQDSIPHTAIILRWQNIHGTEVLRTIVNLP